MSTLKQALVNILLFLFIWLVLGFSLGLALIILPAEWFIYLVETYSLSQEVENHIARFSIAIFSLISASIAVWLVYRIKNAKSFATQAGLLLFVILSGASAFWLYLHPERLTFFENTIEVNDDHVGLIRRAIKKLVPPSVMTRWGSSSHSITSFRYLIDGAVIHLDDQIYMAPKISKEDLTRIARTNLKEFVILNFNSTDNWANEEEKHLQYFSIPVRRIVMTSYPYDPQQVLEVARQLKTLPRPLLIYVQDINSYPVQALIEAYRSNLPVLPLGLFKTPLREGQVTLFNSHVAIGPRPRSEEFKFYLQPRGIDHILYLGDANTSEAITDKQNANDNHLNWQATQNPFNKVISELSPDATWYIYGPHSETSFLAFVDRLSNGPVHRLNIQVYLTPYPTQQELETYFLNSDVQTVIAVTTENNLELNAPANFFNQHGIHFEKFVLPQNYHPEHILKLIDTLWQHSEAVVILLENTDSLLADAIKLAYLTHLPPLPSGIVEHPLAKELQLQLAAPNIAVGKIPQEYDRERLHTEFGIKEIVGIEARAIPNRKEGELYLIEGNLDCLKTIAQSECIYSQLSEGGPWYVYSAETQDVKDALTSRLGPISPDTILYYPSQSNAAEPLFSFFNNSPEDEAHFSAYTNNYFPSLSLTILLTPALVLFAMLSGSFVGWLRTVKKLHHTTTRKIFHLMIFTTAAILQATLHFPSVLLFSLVIVLSLVYAIIQNRGFPFYDAIARPFSEEADRNFSIIIPTLMTAMSALLGFLIFGHFFIVGLLICGWGDAAAELVGVRGHYEYRVPSLIGKSVVKTVEGSVAMLVVGTFVAWVALLILGLDPLSALRIGAAAAVVGTIAEATSNAYIDNFTVQLFSTMTAYYLA